MNYQKRLSVPLPRGSLRHILFIVVVRDDIIQELKQLLELFQLAILVLIEALQLRLVLARKRLLEARERVVTG